VVGSQFPPAVSQTLKGALLRPLSLPDDKIFSRECENIFATIWGSNTCLSYVDSVVPGRAKLRSNLLTNARLKPRTLGMSHSFYKCPIPTRPLRLSRFSDVFYVDASTKETIIAELGQIALAKGLGESEKSTLDWLSRQRKEWLLLLDNADDPTFDLRSYFPAALTAIS